MTRLRSHLTYANVMATIAVFVALGGTSYAVVRLPKNSVGSKQIRGNAVGSSEIRKSAVRSSDIKDRSVAVRDLTLSARERLRGQTGPTGPQGPAGSPVATLSAAVSAGGIYERSNGTSTASSNHRDVGVYSVDFNRDVSTCYAIATVKGNQAGEISVETSPTMDELKRVVVFTRDSAGTLSDRPFHLIVVC
jgi:hypothetical protein